MTVSNEQSPYLNQNILHIEATFYKGCENGQDQAIEIYKTEDKYLVCVDNIVEHVSNGKQNALARYGGYFG